MRRTPFSWPLYDSERRPLWSHDRLPHFPLCHKQQPFPSLYSHQTPPDPLPISFSGHNHFALARHSPRNHSSWFTPVKTNPPTTSPGNTLHTKAPMNLPLKPPHYLSSLILNLYNYSTPLQYAKHVSSETHTQTSFFTTEIPHSTHHTCKPASPAPFFTNNFLFSTNKIPHITHPRSELQPLAKTKSHALAIRNLPLHPPHPQANPHPRQNHIDLTITIPQHRQLKHPITHLKSTLPHQLPTFHATPKSLAQPGQCSHKIAQVCRWGSQPHTL